ncbi:hypothetical protein tinsulaeT_02910 [Thalassotalea insulae]|uniref:Uncharacterized protein n=1 Tax=Thalassotalea insulae TaxID=2056778 RepID=A0ABQ6GQI5_9GAMM|nr:hypothetical protein [Thalassotalea insulae]GLX76951.1 hypothetical protein tinsulaeT_02910 [Thalassotalea insulae]
MAISIIIFAVFISQIWLLSYYYPKQVTSRISYVLEHYTPQEYPKLYPEPPEKILKIKATYLRLNYLGILIGLIIVSYFGFIVEDFNNHLNVLDDIPLLYGMLQYTPVIYLELRGRQQLKLMRKLNKITNRSAELQPRRLFNYIEKKYLVFAVSVYLIFVIFTLITSQFTFNAELGIKLVTVTGINILFIMLGAQNLYGKKRDPLQNHEDREKQIQFTLQSFVFISIFMTIYIMAHSWLNQHQLNYVEIIVNSLYFQVIAIYSLGLLIKRFNIKNVNFDAYRENHNAA